MASDNAAAPGQRADLAALARRLGYDFANPALLAQALTHASRAGGAERSYERMEFLGDRVLGCLVAELLYRTFPTENEGALGKRFAALVRRETLAEVAGPEGLDLGPHLALSRGEQESGGRDNPATLADACEAVIAALYLDGGLETARRLIEPIWTPLLKADPTPPQDAKTRLQEWAQARGLALPCYEEIARSGPDHAPHFTLRVSLSDGRKAEAEGRSKRNAEQAAAEAMLAELAERDT
ncbi:ribonuclease III [Algihabitans albus]|uniref:ribonuclease III n=1 Tax=Algihabitans albus TaxID=2164067 RepID=UPI000E5D0A85|nr:ribonuclease III [Algihabitans albus]